MAAHARRSPSGADTWMLCAGSVSAIERANLPRRERANLPRREQEYSAQGTVCHEVAAQCLEYGFDPYDYVGARLSADGFTFEFSDEMAGWIQPGLDLLREMSGALFVEYRVDLSNWLPGDFGTLDVGVVAPDLITIYDWKFGWKKVEVRNNRQLRIYALGFWWNVARHLTKATRFRLIINQPRDGGVSEWVVDLDDLLAFGEDVRAAGLATEDPNAPCVAGEKQCSWCNLNPHLGGPGCAALTDFNLDIIGQKLGDLDDDIAADRPPTMPLLSGLTPARRYFLVRHRNMFAQWLAALHDESLAAARAGTPDPGSKMVAGDRSDRAWASDGFDDLLGSRAQVILIDALRDEAFTKKLKSPAQIEKLAKPTKRKRGEPELWARLSNLIRQDEGKPILVPEEDPRPALRSVHDLLDEEPDENDVDLLK